MNDECRFDNAHHPRICMTHLEQTGKDHSAALCTHALAALREQVRGLEVTIARMDDVPSRLQLLEQNHVLEVRVVDWQAEATRLAVQVENLEHELGRVNERLRRIVGYINSVAKFAWEMKDDGVAADLARECARKAEIEEASGETACSCTTGEVRDPQDRVPAPAEA